MGYDIRIHKAQRKASREMQLEDATGFTSTHSIHPSKKTYNRKVKHKSKPNV